MKPAPQDLQSPPVALHPTAETHSSDIPVSVPSRLVGGTSISPAIAGCGTGDGTQALAPEPNRNMGTVVQVPSPLVVIEDGATGSGVHLYGGTAAAVCESDTRLLSSHAHHVDPEHDASGAEHAIQTSGGAVPNQGVVPETGHRARVLEPHMGQGPTAQESAHPHIAQQSTRQSEGQSEQQSLHPTEPVRFSAPDSTSPAEVLDGTAGLESIPMSSTCTLPPPAPFIETAIAPYGEQSTPALADYSSIL